MVKDILFDFTPKATQTDKKAPCSFAANGRYLLLLLENIFCHNKKNLYICIDKQKYML